MSNHQIPLRFAFCTPVWQFRRSTSLTFQVQIFEWKASIPSGRNVQTVPHKAVNHLYRIHTFRQENTPEEPNHVFA